MTFEQTIIRRFQRNGHVQWQNIANVLGRSIDSCRAEFAPTQGFELVAASPEPEPPKVTLEEREEAILHVMATADKPLSVGFIIRATKYEKGAVKRRLEAMRKSGRVIHDTTAHRWSVAPVGAAPEV